MSTVEVSVLNGEISVDKETLSMVGKGRNAPIQWDVVTPEWTFPGDGIVIENNNGQFSHLRPVDQGRKFECIDKNDGGGSYKYTIKLTNGHNTLVLDPTIQNEP